MVKTLREEIKKKPKTIFRFWFPLVVIDGGELPGSFTADLTDKPAELKVTTHQDECNLVYTVNANYWYVKMPTFHYRSRNVACNIPPPVREDEPLPPSPLTTPITIPDDCGIGGAGLFWKPYKLDYADGFDADGLERYEYFVKIDEWDYSFAPLGIINGQNYHYLVKAKYETKSKMSAYMAINGKGLRDSTFQEFIDYGWNIPSDWKTNPRAFLTRETSHTIESYHNLSRARVYYVENPLIPESQPELPYFQILNNLDTSIYPRNKKEFRRGIPQEFSTREIIPTSILSDFETRNFPFIREGTDFYGKYYIYETSTLSYRIDEIALACKPFKSNEILPPPPPPPMSCCPNVRENDALLKLIARRIGIYDYPVAVPKNIADSSKGNISLENLTRFTSYLVKQLDAVSGNYPIEIEIEDADLTQEGNQKQTIKIPNAAEGIAETLGQLLVIRTETSATLNGIIRALVEIASTKQTALITHDYAKSNSEFLGYKGKQITRKVPFSTNVGKERLDEFLKESEIDVKGFENDDNEDIRSILIPLLEMAAQYRAQNYRHVGTKNPYADLKTILERGVDVLSLLDKDVPNYPKAPGNMTEEDFERQENKFDTFIENAETGFINKPGITDDTNPYGRPYDERPRIREIGNTTGE
jgi:hypothetical protein